MDKTRGQGTFEYILLIAGVTSVVIVGFLILRQGLLAPANQQVAGSLGTYSQLTNACQALSSLVIDPTGSNATLTLCQMVDGNATMAYLYSAPIVFNGAIDQPGNMTFSVADGVSQVFLNIIGKNGTTLDMNQTHCVDVLVNGSIIIKNLCGTVGATTPVPTPTPTPTPTGPPIISGVTSNPGETNATVGWTTDTPSNTSISLGQSPGMYLQSGGINDNTTAHSTALLQLAPNTRYYFRATSCNPYGCNSSAEYNFTTLSFTGQGGFNNTDFNVTLSGINPNLLFAPPTTASFASTDFNLAPSFASISANLTDTPTGAYFASTDFYIYPNTATIPVNLTSTANDSYFASTDFYTYRNPTNPGTTLTSDPTTSGFAFTDFNQNNTAATPPANVTGS